PSYLATRRSLPSPTRRSSYLAECDAPARRCAPAAHRLAWLVLRAGPGDAGPAAGLVTHRRGRPRLPRARPAPRDGCLGLGPPDADRKSTRLDSSHVEMSYGVV